MRKISLSRSTNSISLHAAHFRLRPILRPMYPLTKNIMFASDSHISCKLLASRSIKNACSQLHLGGSLGGDQSDPTHCTEINRDAAANAFCCSKLKPRLFFS